MKTNRKILKIAGIGFLIAAAITLFFFDGEGVLTFTMLSVGCFLFKNLSNKDGEINKNLLDELKIAAVIFAVVLIFCSVILFLIKNFI